MENSIVANYLNKERFCKIVKSKPTKDWMDNTQERFAYRCLPMSIVNQISWSVLCPSDIEVTWTGNPSVDSVSVTYLEPTIYDFAKSEFGHGIVTFHPDFVLQTNRNNCIYMKGPSNSHKRDIQPLEGIVETFWLPFTATMNWKFDKPSTVQFLKGEVLFSFFPIQLDFLETFDVSCIDMADDISLTQKYTSYTESRTEHIEIGHTNGESWQKYYMQGKCPYSQIKAEHHKTKINLQDFKEKNES